MIDETKRKNEDPEAPEDQQTNAVALAAAGNGAEPVDEHDLIDRIKRLQAEFENYKKRVAREASERQERIADQFLLEVHPLYDGVHLAFENYNRDHDAEAFVAGIERIFAQFEQILKAKGVARIEAIGESFDPAVHEALMRLPSDQEKNTIVEVFSPGYVRNGRTLRPGKVGVSQGPAAVKEEEG